MSSCLIVMTIECYNFPMGVDNGDKQKLVNFLRHIGLSTDETAVYLQLSASGPQSVLSLSRKIGTGRTKLYPVLDSLKSKRLVKAHELHYGTAYEASGPEYLDHLVSRNEAGTAYQRNSLPEAISIIQEVRQTSPHTSVLAEYNGLDGIKRILWEHVRAETTHFRLFEPPSFATLLGRPFYKRLRDELTLNGKSIQTITNLPRRRPGLGGERSTSVPASLWRIDTPLLISSAAITMITDVPPGLRGVKIQNADLARQHAKFFDFIVSQANSGNNPNT